MWDSRLHLMRDGDLGGRIRCRDECRQDEVNRAAEQVGAEDQRWPPGFAGQPGKDEGPNGGAGTDGAQQQPESAWPGVQVPVG